MAEIFSCDACEALLPEYLLRTLAVEEIARLVAHLQTCTRCQASLAAYEAVLDRLAYDVPQYDPPAAVRQRLQEALTGPLSPALPLPAALPVAQTKRWRWAVTVAAANLLLCLGTWWWAWSVWRHAASVHERWEQLQGQLALQQQALVLSTTAETRSVALRSDKAESRAHGTLFVRMDDPNAVLVVQGLPPLPPERAYQLWLVWGDRQRDNGGVFHVDAQGFGVLHIAAPRPLTTYRAVGITEEPRAGSPGPTTPRVIGGSL